MNPEFVTSFVLRRINAKDKWMKVGQRAGSEGIYSMKYILLLILVVVLSSCTLRHRTDVTLVIPETHPLEEVFSETFWFTLTYFDGEKLEERHIPKGTRRISVSVRSGGLSVFSLKPLGELGAIGGFFEPGDRRTIHLLPEYGTFSEMLLRAASYRAEPVFLLSMRRVIDTVSNLQAVDESSFLKDIFDGTLGYGITLNEKIAVHFDSIPRGEWISERYDIQSFSVAFSGDNVTLLLYPGVYRYAEKTLRMLLTVIVEETGDSAMMITALPSW